MKIDNAIETIEEAIEIIEKEAYWFKASELKKVIKMLKKQPQIVLCKDCKHQNWVNAETGCIVCKFGRGTNAPDWFCADGKRREDE